MFGKKTAKKMQQQAEAAQAQQQQFMQQAAQPTPLQSAEDKSNLEFLDWESGKSGPVDVTKAPGMNPYLDLYNRATAARDEERQGGGGLVTMGATGTNPELAALIQTNLADRRRERAGGALAEALRQRSAQAHGYVLPSSSLTQGRQLSLAGLASGNANNAWARFLEQQARAGFFSSNLFNQYMRAASQVAAGGG